MCSGKEVKCTVEVSELDNGYQIQIKGDKVKEALKAEHLKNCIQACCSGKGPCEDTSCR